MVEKRRFRPATIQSHFQFKQLTSYFHGRPDGKDATRVYRVTDRRGRTSKASSNEYFVAKALETLGFEFAFQLSVAGGRSLSFGIVLDFLVETVPLPTPLWVHGDYWHTGERRQKDLRQQDIVKQFLMDSILEPIEIWGHESNTPEMAQAAVRRKLL